MHCNIEELLEENTYHKQKILCDLYCTSALVGISKKVIPKFYFENCLRRKLGVQKKTNTQEKYEPVMRHPWKGISCPNRTQQPLRTLLHYSFTPFYDRNASHSVCLRLGKQTNKIDATTKTSFTVDPNVLGILCVYLHVNSNYYQGIKKIALVPIKSGQN